MGLIIVFGVGMLVVIAGVLCGILDRLNKILILLAKISSLKKRN